jgi:hypothetical protein
MTWSFLPARSNFRSYALHWDALNERLYRSHPLLSSGFVEPLVTHFASESDVLAIHREANEVDGLLLLTPSRYKWQTFLPSQTQIAPVLVSSPHSVVTLRSALPPTVAALDLLCLDPEYSIAAGLRQHPCHEDRPHATTLNISLSGSFEDYWQARSRKLRQNIRRSLRSIEDAGISYALHVRDEVASVQQGLETYAAIESRGWKGRAGTAIRLDSTQGRFYADVLTRLTQVGAAAIYELHLDAAVVASQIVLHNRQMLITLKTTHDEQYASFSPGYVLDYLLLKREFAAQRFSVVEYYTNATAELLRWGTGQRVISHHRLYRYAWMGPIIRGLRRLGLLNPRQRAHEAQPVSACGDS